jgi:O-antigen biosynthesis protein
LAQVVRWLNADPTLDVLYTDEDIMDSSGQLSNAVLKPDWSPDLLTTQNYVCHMTVARKSLVEDVGGLRSEYDGSQDWDLVLRLTERSPRIAHIPEPLYSWRAVPGSVAEKGDAKPYAFESGRRAVADALQRRGYPGRADCTPWPGWFRARYSLPGRPKVSIIIPTKDRVDLLRNCVESITERSTYKDFEVVVIDNQSTEAETLEYLAKGPARVVRYPARFNYARMMNLAARSVECDAMLFLNNDTEVISPDWIESLLEHAMRPEVGAVGGRLFYPDGEPQHEGILIGVAGPWALNVNHRGYGARGELTRNVSAVTGACTMIRPSVYWRVGGNDERLRVGYNDVDLCMRIRQAGYQVVYNPYVELYHHESASRSRHHENALDGPLFGSRWHPRDSVDPYYNPILSEELPFTIRI